MENDAGTKPIPEVYISQLHFNNDQTVEINKNDIVVFVGPNNVGKSQTLKDIWDIADKAHAGVVVKRILVQKDSSERLIEHLQTFSSKILQGKTTYFSGLNFFVSSDLFSHPNPNHLRDCRNAFVCYLRTDDRLSACMPPEVLYWIGAPKNPIHQIIKCPRNRKTYTKYFKKAFGIPSVPNLLHGKTTPLCLGSIPQCSMFEAEDAHDFVEKYREYMNHLPLLHNQGDGMRSFAAVLLYLSIDFYHTFLIDEPESFLHPPQATVMGQIIAEMLNGDQQAFISTHSQHLIKGLLEKAPDRVKIIRITRTGNQNSFSILDNERISELLRDPLLKHSDILDGMFYKNVVICESDSDCRFYSIINDYLKQQAESFSETLFIHSGGKGRMEKLVQALKALCIVFRVIPDIDILNQENTFKSIIEACGGSWTVFRTDYNTLVNGLDNVKNLTGHQLIESIEAKLSNILETELSRTKLEELKNLLDYRSRWTCIKQNGISGAPAGNATRSLHNMVDYLKEIGIYVVPVGELECFVKDVGGHGPQWLNNVLEHHPDLNDEIFKAAKEFVASWNI